MKLNTHVLMMFNSHFDVIFTPQKVSLGLILGYLYPYTPRRYAPDAYAFSNAVEPK